METGESSSASWIWQWLRFAAVVGAIPGGLLGFYLAVIASALWGFSLDGPGGPPPTPLQLGMLFLGFPAAGATAGSGLAVSVTGIWAFFRIRPDRFGIAGKLARVAMGLLLLLGFVLLVLALAKFSAR